MRLNGLRARPRRPFRPRLPSPITRPPSPNLLSEAGSPSVPGAQLVSDITYIPTREGWLFWPWSSISFPRHSRLKPSDSLHADLVVGAATRAFQSGLVPGENLSLRSRLPILRHHHPRVARPTWLARKHQRERRSSVRTLFRSPSCSLAPKSSATPPPRWKRAATDSVFRSSSNPSSLECVPL